ncbi:hypothetical protein M011DRAFT_413921 [Sporormia fimetaria CBS 119925]|uniref:A-kinase anchor protein 7-like phosphoesterase domain-containing protein n=1 Tax=Sporormia fimetaria CBS 119925 TaxID=1340428 RepID=A0A6A6UWA1_9PLEO|nr:hypothetical protein M011DRAFT_413921 [Sporormia fimetaria CBS 119925]
MTRRSHDSSKSKSKSKSKNNKHHNNNHPKAGKKPQLTHFLCLPLVTETTRPQLQTGLERLGKEVEESGVVPRKAVRPVGTLHLTLGVMSLDGMGVEGVGEMVENLDVSALFEEETTTTEPHTGVTQPAAAAEVGKTGIEPEPQADQEPQPHPLTISLRSLTPMQAPHKTSILYAEPVDPSGRLPGFANRLRSYFEERGVVVKEGRALRLHATVLNTIYAKPKNRGGKKGTGGGWKGKGKGKERVRPKGDVMSAEMGEEASAPERAEGHGVNAKSWRNFDARELIERYRDFVWAEEVVIDRIQVCKMGAKKLVNESGEVVDEEYEVVFEKRF